MPNNDQESMTSLTTLSVFSQFNLPPEKQFASMDCLNLIVMLNQKKAGGRSDICLVGTPGLDLFIDLNAAQVRGLLFYYNVFYAVIDNKFVSISANGQSSNVISTINTSSGIVTFITNTTQILINDIKNKYVYTPASGGFITVSTLPTPTSSSMTYMDGYGFVVDINGNTIYASALNDFTSWPALQITGIISTSNKVQSCVATHSRLWISTDINTEDWYNAGNASAFPFSRTPNISIEFGIAAPATMVKADDMTTWLARTPYGGTFLVTAKSYSPTVLSSSAINSLWSTYSKIDDAFAFSYEDRGQCFYQITFPSVPATFLFNLKTGLASRLESMDSNGQTLNRHLANCSTYGNNITLVGDYNSGKIYKMSNTTYAEGVNPVRRSFGIAPIRADGKRLTVRKIQLDMEVGVGNTVDPDSNPQIVMQYSKDGGKTFPVSRPRSLGKLGKYRNRVQWFNCSSSRDWRYRWDYVGTNQIAFFEIYINAEVGDS